MSSNLVCLQTEMVWEEIHLTDQFNSVTMIKISQELSKYQ